MLVENERLLGLKFLRGFVAVVKRDTQDTWAACKQQRARTGVLRKATAYRRPDGGDSADGLAET